MPELSPIAQTWVQVVLVWIGFGSLAGLLARMLLPMKEPASPLSTLTVGIAGSAVGLGVVSLVKGGGPSNPISLLGFLAAIAGAFGLLVVYHVLRFTVHREIKPAAVAPEPATPLPTVGPKVLDLRSDISDA